MGNINGINSGARSIDWLTDPNDRTDMFNCTNGINLYTLDEADAIADGSPAFEFDSSVLVRPGTDGDEPDTEALADALDGMEPYVPDALDMYQCGGLIEFDTKLLTPAVIADALRKDNPGKDWRRIAFRAVLVNPDTEGGDDDYRFNVAILVNDTNED